MSDAKISIIGYALNPKTTKNLITPSLLNYAQNQGIHLLHIDTTKPLAQQGPFHAIIHKLYSDDWKQQLYSFASANPHIIIIDNPVAVDKLHNRISMLQIVSKLNILSHNHLFITSPKQVVIRDSSEKFVGDLKFPVIAKPLLANASANSHKMSLVFNSDGLKELDPPILLQEFVNHGGVLFKVYVAGKYVKCVKRNSLPDVTEKMMKSGGGSGNLMPFSQISNTSTTSEDDDDDEEEDEDEKVMPPMSFVNEVASGLREAMGLHLFNFDMIRDADNHDCYHVIDINYFPGYEKLPDYESVLTDFFKEIMNVTCEIKTS